MAFEYAGDISSKNKLLHYI